ncbi:MAG: threonine--tRNA ligase, partial [Myxococcota bacterium]
MADAVQRLFPGTQVTFGPATEHGFYYDFDRPAGQFSDDELRRIEKKMAEIIAADLPFRREVLPRSEARRLLRGLNERYKLEHLETLSDPISVYRHGDWVDLCKGPHVPSTRFLRAFRLTAVSGAYWRGDERNPMLQRIYGTAFATPKELKKYLQRIEEAKKRDHRKLGVELDLFRFHPWAPASPFFLPRGAAVYQNLLAYVRELYRLEGYEEVITPQVFDADLFRTSGHLPEYGPNMYMVATEDTSDPVSQSEKPESATPISAAPRDAERDDASGRSSPQVVRPPKAVRDEQSRFGLKPMNCPGHALMFGMRRRSYRELPWRIADFGRLHRNERSGVLQGLTRVRTFV